MVAGNHMVTCLIVGLQKAGHKDINFDKLWEITQRLDENLAISSQVNGNATKIYKLRPHFSRGHHCP